MISGLSQRSTFNVQRSTVKGQLKVTRSRATLDTRPIAPPRPTIAQESAIILSARTTFALMSHSQSTAASSSSFQLILNNAMKAYEKSTKQDLLCHPLASQLQACNSPVAVLTVLQQQVHGLDQSQSSDDRRTKWLVPTVKVLYPFSATLEERVGLVSLRI
jgi:hypothetical protein